MTDATPGEGIAAVFFDLGDTLGTPVFSGQPPRLTSFDVFPHVPGLLAKLRNQGLRLGVISNTGDETAATMNPILQSAGLLALLDAALLVYSGDERITKSSPEIFDRAAARAGLPPRRCMFVGENKGEREVAESAGWVSAHPRQVR